MKKEISFVVLFFVVLSLFAQKRSHVYSLGKINQDTLAQSNFLKKYTDTLSVIRHRYLGVLDSINNDSVAERFIELNPYYYRLFVPFTYYYSPVTDVFNPKPMDFDVIKETGYNPDEWLPINKSNFDNSNKINRFVNKVLLTTYVNHPNFVVNWEDNINRKSIYEVKEIGRLKPKTSVISLFKPDPIHSSVNEVSVAIKKPNFWYFGGSGSMQFSQNYISANWYKGGESTNTMLINLQLNANYDDKQKLQFDNRFEANIGLSTIASDTIRQYKINTDLLRLSSKLGIRATSKWFYTISGEFNTQFFRNYKVNSILPVSTFMAPANLIFGVGMDYKVDKKNLNLSVFVSPATYNLRYVGNKDIDETQFGLKEGRTVLHDIGSKLQTNLKWTVFPSISWESRLYYFTNYLKVEAEWENTFNFVLNRYLSTKLFLHWRYDDGIARKGNAGYFQLIELFSFGLNYSW